MKKKRKEKAEAGPEGASNRERVLFLTISAAVIIGVLVFYQVTRRDMASSVSHPAVNGKTEEPEIQALLERFHSHPDDPDVMRELGNRYYDSGDLARAELFYKEVLKIEPENVDVMVDLGTVSYYTDQPEEAIRYYERALALKPDYKNALFNIGLVKRAIGDREGAAESWNRFMEVAADDPHVEAIREMITEMEEEGGKDE